MFSLYFRFIEKIQLYFLIFLNVFYQIIYLVYKFIFYQAMHYFDLKKFKMPLKEEILF